MQKNVCQWRVSDENIINLTSGSNWTDLMYENVPWKNTLEMDEGQQKAVEREVNHRKGAGKF